MVRYRIVGMAGPGLVAVFAPNNLYLRVSERQDEYGIKESLAVAYRDRAYQGAIAAPSLGSTRPRGPIR